MAVSNYKYFVAVFKASPGGNFRYAHTKSDRGNYLKISNPREQNPTTGDTLTISISELHAPQLLHHLNTWMKQIKAAPKHLSKLDSSPEKLAAYCKHGEFETSMFPKGIRQIVAYHGDYDGIKSQLAALHSTLMFNKIGPSKKMFYTPMIQLIKKQDTPNEELFEFKGEYNIIDLKKMLEIFVAERKFGGKSKNIYDVDDVSSSSDDESEDVEGETDETETETSSEDEMLKKPAVKKTAPKKPTAKKPAPKKKAAQMELEMEETSEEEEEEEEEEPAKKPAPKKRAARKASPSKAPPTKKPRNTRRAAAKNE